MRSLVFRQRQFSRYVSGKLVEIDGRHAMFAHQFVYFHKLCHRLQDTHKNIDSANHHWDVGPDSFGKRLNRKTGGAAQRRQYNDWNRKTVILFHIFIVGFVVQ
jgi:hypothetical protein